MLVRGAPQGQRSRYVNCDGVSTLGADLRPRQAFSRRVALRNYAEAQELLERCLHLAPEFDAARQNYAGVLNRQAKAPARTSR